VCGRKRYSHINFFHAPLQCWDLIVVGFARIPQHTQNVLPQQRSGALIDFSAVVPAGVEAGRPLLAAGIALVVALVLGPFVIRFLRQRCGERIASDSARLNELHSSKQKTPTMGGVLIIAAFLVGAGTCVQWGTAFVWLVAGMTLLLCGVGACDDWIKLRTSKKGLTVRQKFIAQAIVAIIASVALAAIRGVAAGRATSLSGWLPEGAQWLMIPWAAFVIVGASNAVNLTDGLDGLAAGCTVITGTAMTVIISWSVGDSLVNSGTHAAVHQDAAVFSGAITAAAAGFLWFNRHPARVFMGDTGSLPIGGLLALLALACEMEFVLLITGAVFVVEVLSVILQVGWYRRTQRRVLLCSPLHNHFVFQSVKEVRIVRAFWLAACVCSLLGMVLWYASG